METEIIRINLVLSNQIEGFLRKNLVDVLDPWWSISLFHILPTSLPL